MVKKDSSIISAQKMSLDMNSNIVSLASSFSKFLQYVSRCMLTKKKDKKKKTKKKKRKIVTNSIEVCIIGFPLLLQ